MNHGEVFENLRKQGHRITPQRQRILELFQTLPEGNHLSAEELQELLRKQDIKISLATLYRTLKFLTSNGLLRELDFGEEHKHYEISTSNKPHHHLICNKCGATIEFENQRLFKYAQEAAFKENGFIIKDYQFKIFGICKYCQN